MGTVTDDVGASAPQVTVVVPTYDRRERLAKVLESLAAQDLGEPFEVIVVSDGSSDGTDEYLRSGDTPLDVVAVAQPNQGPAAARNTGIERATGELIVFIDDDVVADPSLLRAHRDAHRRLGDHAVVIGPMLDPPDHPMSAWIAWEQMMLAKQYRAMERGDYGATYRQFYTGNASVRAEHLRRAGGFDTTFRRAEDVELAFRLHDIGLDFHYEPSAIGLHYAERSYETWRRTAYEYGRNDIVFARDGGRDWLFRFIHDSYRWRHFTVRWMVRGALRSRRFGDAIIRIVERSVRRLSDHAGGRWIRLGLSAVYAVEYHRGLSDELGSVDALEYVIEHGEGPRGRR